MNIEAFAKELHEAGREAVEAGATVAADHHGEKARKFLGWDEITENAREGRRIQARCLLKRFNVSPKSEGVAEAARRGYADQTVGGR